MGQEFLAPGVHFEALLATLPQEQQELYRRLNHIRQEPSFRGRSFVIYGIRNRQPEIIDELKVLDFIANDSVGASCEIRSDRTGKTLTVGYAPVQVFNYPVFMHLPLHAKLRWSTTEGRVHTGKLAFDIAIRTETRISLRERQVIYCETGVNYAKEFEGLKS